MKETPRENLFEQRRSETMRFAYVERGGRHAFVAPRRSIASRAGMLSLYNSGTMMFGRVFRD